ncbi:unnamed protein product [Peronospora destructor]|uniref:ADF-H domain-containing protein n=1 Tax=Peronospora destructor TaxID=86335 RepID=A0AAV0UDT0_9STRA|nr:unnamed protein product [Peronospora destructor]
MPGSATLEEIEALALKQSAHPEEDQVVTITFVEEDEGEKEGNMLSVLPTAYCLPFGVLSVIVVYYSDDGSGRAAVATFYTPKALASCTATSLSASIFDDFAHFPQNAVRLPELLSSLH